MYCLFCVVLCIVCVYMCTELLPPGGHPIAVICIIPLVDFQFWTAKKIVRGKGKGEVYPITGHEIPEGG